MKSVSPANERAGQIVRIAAHLCEACAFVLPVFNDWDSLILLLRDLDQVAATLRVDFVVSIVNGGFVIGPLKQRTVADLDW